MVTTVYSRNEEVNIGQLRGESDLQPTSETQTDLDPGIEGCKIYEKLIAKCKVRWEEQVIAGSFTRYCREM